MGTRNFAFLTVVGCWLSWPSHVEAQNQKPELVLAIADVEGVYCVAFAPGGKLILTGDIRNAALWDVATGQKIRAFEGYCISPDSVALSPDGKWLLTILWPNRTIALWDTATGERLRVFEAHKGTVHSVGFSPNGEQILTRGHDRTAILWDAKSGEKLRTIEGAQLAASPAFGPDSKLLLTDTLAKRPPGDKTEEKKFVLDDFSKATGPVAFTPDARRAVTIGPVPTLWDITRREKLQTFRPEDLPTSVAISPDADQVLIGGYALASLFKTSSGQKLRTFSGHAGRITSVAFSPDGKQVLTGSSDQTAIIWDVTDGKQLRRFGKQTDRIGFTTMNRGGNKILTSRGGSLVLWDMLGGKGPETVANYTAIAGAFGPDETQALTGSADKKAILWDLTNTQKVRTFTGHTRDVCRVAFSPDGKQVASGSQDGTVILWDARTGQQVRLFHRFKTKLQSLQFSPDGKYIVGVGDGVAVQWDADSANEVRTLKASQGSVVDATLGPDGQMVLAEAGGQTALVFWDPASGKRLRILLGRFGGSVSSVAVAGDGRRALAGGLETVAWEVLTGKKLHTLEQRGRSTTFAAFTANGERILTASNDHALRLWDVKSGRELAQIYTFDGVKDWLVVSPDGYYDGSEGAKQVVTYRVNDRIAFAKECPVMHRPGLLASMLQGKGAQ